MPVTTQGPATSPYTKASGNADENTMRVILSDDSPGAGGGSGLTDTQLRATPVPVTDAAIPAGLTVDTLSLRTNIARINDFPIATDQGVTGNNVQRVIVAGDQELTRSLPVGSEDGSNMSVKYLRTNIDGALSNIYNGTTYETAKASANNVPHLLENGNPDGKPFPSNADGVPALASDGTPTAVVLAATTEGVLKIGVDATTPVALSTTDSGTLKLALDTGNTPVALKATDAGVLMVAQDAPDPVALAANAQGVLKLLNYAGDPYPITGTAEGSPNLMTDGADAHSIQCTATAVPKLFENNSGDPAQMFVDAQGVPKILTDGATAFVFPADAQGTPLVASNPTPAPASLQVTAEGALINSPKGNATSVVTEVPAVATTDTNLIAANTLRRGGTVFYNGAATFYVKLGSGAAANSFTKIVSAADPYFEIPFDYTGDVNGFWSAAVGNAYVTEITV